MSEHPELRFWQHVDKNCPPPTHKPELGPCWIWTGAGCGNGYGQIVVRKRVVTTHRFSWQLHNGSDPGKLFVCHACDNPSCIRPDHLFLGDDGVNVRDMIAKGRGVSQASPHLLARGDANGSRKHPERLRRGENAARAKLTPDIVREVRSLHADGVSARAIAQRFGVTGASILDIVHGRSWRHVA